MKCKKRRYRDELDAKLALSSIRFKDKASRPKQERRYYRCGQCQGWHLTSRP